MVRTNRLRRTGFGSELGLERCFMLTSSIIFVANNTSYHGIMVTWLRYFFEKKMFMGYIFMWAYIVFMLVKYRA